MSSVWYSLGGAHGRWPCRNVLPPQRFSFRGAINSEMPWICFSLLKQERKGFYIFWRHEKKIVFGHKLDWRSKIDHFGWTNDRNGCTYTNPDLETNLKNQKWKDGTYHNPQYGRGRVPFRHDNNHVKGKINCVGKQRGSQEKVWPGVRCEGYSKRRQPRGLFQMHRGRTAHRFIKD